MAAKKGLGKGLDTLVIKHAMAITLEIRIGDLMRMRFRNCPSPSNFMGYCFPYS